MHAAAYGGVKRFLRGAVATTIYYWTLACGGFCIERWIKPVYAGSWIHSLSLSLCRYVSICINYEDPSKSRSHIISHLMHSHRSAIHIKSLRSCAYANEWLVAFAPRNIQRLVVQEFSVFAKGNLVSKYSAGSGSSMRIIIIIVTLLWPAATEIAIRNLSTSCTRYVFIFTSCITCELVRRVAMLLRQCFDRLKRTASNAQLATARCATLL